MKATISLTHAYTNWALKNIRREWATRYAMAKEMGTLNALVQEYVRAVLLEHKASWEEMENGD